MESHAATLHLQRTPLCFVNWPNKQLSRTEGAALFMGFPGEGSRRLAGASSSLLQSRFLMIFQISLHKEGSLQSVLST